MKILGLGLNHKTAPVKTREQLSFTSSNLCAFLNRLGRPQKFPPLYPDINNILYESIVLSTCNRLEYYALSPQPEQATQAIISLLSQTFNLPENEFTPHLYYLECEEAIKHLMRVSSGLDSLVLGESQILGQVVSAHQIALAHNTTGTILSRLFETAIHAGKRARTETAIGVNPASVSSVATHLARRHLGDLANKTVMILGAGEMGVLAIQSLLKQGLKKLLIVNRTREHAEELANQFSATAFSFDEIDAALIQADVVITSTGAPHTVLHRHQIDTVMENRPKHRLLVIDIAVPRDVEPDIGNIPNVYLYNLDHLQSQVEDNLNARQQEIPKVDKIIAQEATSFLNWYRSLGVVPTITTFRRQFDDLRRQELERALNRLDHLDERDQAAINELTHRLMNKFLHEPTIRLREEAARGNGIHYTTALQKLFALEPDHS